MTPKPSRATVRPHLSIEDAYRDDPTFRTVVDMIEHMIHRADITPAEARGAAVLACIHYEMHTVQSFRVTISADGYAALDRAEARIHDLRRWIDAVNPEPREPA